jgi:hypothetical protein
MHATALHDLGPRTVIRLAVLRAHLRRIWEALAPWLAGAALVLAYLLVQQWIEATDTREALRASNAANVELDFEVQRLKDDLAEANSNRTQKLIYLIEADSTREAKDKLSRLALMVAEQHYNLSLAEARR